LLHHDGTDKTPQDVSIPKFWEEWNVKFPPDTQKNHPDDDMDRDASSSSSSSSSKLYPRDKVYMLQRKKGKLGSKTLGRTTGWIHRAVLSKASPRVVEQWSGIHYDKVDENGHLHITLADGITKRILEVDHIVVCAGQEVNHTLWLECQNEDQEELEEAPNASAPNTTTPFWNDRVYTIGGAYQAGELDAKRAMDMGTRLAMEIHLDTHSKKLDCYMDRPPTAEEKMYQWLQKWRK
jgi:2,4-dienoyl-CoA reductase (NADPH2)